MDWIRLLKAIGAALAIVAAGGTFLFLILLGVKHPIILLGVVIAMGFAVLVSKIYDSMG